MLKEQLGSSWLLKVVRGEKWTKDEMAKEKELDT